MNDNNLENFLEITDAEDVELDDAVLNAVNGSLGVSVESSQYVDSSYDRPTIFSNDIALLFLVDEKPM